jgi:hypothetical protein
MKKILIILISVSSCSPVRKISDRASLNALEKNITTLEKWIVQDYRLGDITEGTYHSYRYVLEQSRLGIKKYKQNTNTKR